jgi:putative membrane protein
MAETAKPDTAQLALSRTWLASERTLMAWVRTATSMISFGFTIYKFFAIEAGGNFKKTGLVTPRAFAIVMVSIGVASLLLATIQHRLDVRTLRPMMEPPRRSLTEGVAALVSFFGIAVLLIAAFHA